jgi:D-alanyl-D-alanine carboxypeptidase
MKAAQLLERGFGSRNGLGWLMPSLGTVETLQPISEPPPNLRDEMCGGHRKRPASEDEDEQLPAEVGPDSPYGVFLSSLRPKGKGAGLLQESNLGEPVLVFTGAKPPPPGTVQAWPRSKPEKRKAVTAAKAPGGKDAASGKPAAAKASMTPVPAGETAPKPRPRKPAAKGAPASTPVSQQTTQAR